MERDLVRPAVLTLFNLLSAQLTAFPQFSQAEKQRTVRHRENKRRYRARRQEYVADLERRLADGRQQDVAAMREVQVAAQKVVNENARLRALLQVSGVEDKVIESWLHGDETCARARYMDNALSLPSSISTPMLLAPVSAKSCDLIKGPCSERQQTSSKSTQTCSTLRSTPSPPQACRNDAQKPVTTLRVGEDSASTCHVSSPLNKSDPSRMNVSEQSPRCMTISHVLGLPNIQSENPADGEIASGDVECTRAYQMVMPFATSTDKVDTISMKLKQGCVRDKKNGGCKVKADVMWEILESAMDDA
ncbi:hypothetical protein PV08_08862 [Exophiala spinifera]|uniref:BZIP domain-containing protein n=1 Tax=Exophiala spinifera TaxID=91928 RepID=A0A0D1YF25_9EURO|nr:uncharacterized protein PV08_08862 [Exophiala spinifera]KIW13671.1 hypothetical protein PV08_08862 [Exophiala spinifera]